MIDLHTAGSIWLDTTKKGHEEITLNCSRIIRLWFQGEKNPTQDIGIQELLRACREFVGRGCQDVLSRISQTRGLLVRQGRGQQEEMVQVASCCSSSNLVSDALLHGSPITCKRKLHVHLHSPRPVLRRWFYYGFCCSDLLSEAFLVLCSSKQRLRSGTNRFKGLSTQKPRSCFSLLLSEL